MCASLAAELHEGRQVDLKEVVPRPAERRGRRGRHTLGAVPVEGLVELGTVLLEHLPHLVHLARVDAELVVVRVVAVVGLDHEMHEPVLAAARPVGLEGGVAAAVRLVELPRVSPPVNANSA